MTERPILFSAPMVRAILAGTKTQTRRVVKGAPDDWAPMQPQSFWTTVIRRGVEEPGEQVYGAGNEDGDCWITCPYGQPGDRLWVRETWGLFKKTPDDHVHACVRGDRRADGFEPHYRATDTWDMPAGAWRPSIHMPRWACRLELEITGVRVERLQAISEADALAEGISSVRSQSWDRQHFPEWRFLFDEAVQAGAKPPIGPSPAQAFEKLWASINGPDSWDANPWVWVVEFKRAA